MEEGAQEGETNREVGAAPALISVHPLEQSIVLAVGYELRVFDLEMDCAVSLTDEACSPSHSDSIRAICFGANGKLFVSAGDDKLVKIWRTDTWHCIRTVCSDKRVSAVAISHDGLFVTFADKFGVVWIVGLEEDVQGQESANKKAVPLLGHYCSIITSLKFSPDGQFIATADRDFKIRISVFPKEHLKGAHEIQNFCLGHTETMSLRYSGKLGQMMCRCGLPSLLFTSRQTHSYGRQFYRCPRWGQGPDDCKFLRWVDGGTISTISQLDTGARSSIVPQRDNTACGSNSSVSTISQSDRFAQGSGVSDAGDMGRDMLLHYKVNIIIFLLIILTCFFFYGLLLYFVVVCAGAFDFCMYNIFI
ncbi:tRNA (guanine-N(7)-)-methyltransferase non-catalytic subunit WDR4 isoform X2 [Phalaenopsis equestris]|uniref:tRNA (guanine-N(7)-)-methyltransferase non-catalytic subunit WDR4 isoform X2 n=1 Tax=Phalaenopsis equestris TaxID=78828 RepID=UPI0009E18F0D|nr:tRNA (guanine-N(7)-)-methyltransferase non-catalytic subunit WDR4 isoform X2 [Phalaenopsis equestris]